MPWGVFCPPVVAYIVFEMQRQQREFELDQQRWDGESPAYQQE